MPAAKHRAYVFDIDRFDAELRPPLDAALRADDPAPLRRFIEDHQLELKDPYAGEPLGDNWEDLLETRDVQEYGDFALTLYYDPSADLGLGGRWQPLLELLVRHAPPGTDLTMGDTVGPPNRPFDPGGLGSYFLTNEMAQARLDTLRELSASRLELREAIAPLAEMFATIANSGHGAYVTF
jgi:hypothetical protein